jgi:2'-5' RNA ligase
MKYYIVHILKGEPKSYIENLRSTLAKEFSIKNAVGKEPPHITIKYGFKVSDINLIEDVLKKVCKKHSKTACQLSGFNYFEDHTIYVRVIPTKKLLDFYKDIYESLNALDSIKWDKFDDEEPLSMHSTIVSKEKGIPKFQEVWDYISKENMSFDITINTLSIVACDNRSWKIIKEFRIR